ncbi:unnamed protein product [Mytilus coruscus]|uniref:Uncharacterized protein n=1 Tax=Mytilus coruscus TaxID=42192 RepID=A0A6J8CYI4_MYTCO|nr:unnamed protein product [Mytilus coruscus]
MLVNDVCVEMGIKDIINLSEHNYDEQVAVCTESGLLPSLSCDLKICSSHVTMYLERNEKRKRRKLCEIPFLINSHEQSDAKRRSDREMSLSNVEIINTFHGLVLPVGTGICRDCRKLLLDGQNKAVKNLLIKKRYVLLNDIAIKILDENNLAEVHNKQTRKIDQVTALDDSGPIKRTRKTITVISDPFSILKDTCSQETCESEQTCLSQISESSSCNSMKLEALNRFLSFSAQYKFKAAKKHCKEFGTGEPVMKTKQTREKFDTDQLEHFIEFITSGHIIKDQPFGEKTLKLTNGEIIKIPSVIRSLAPSTIILQYTALCKEENIKPLGSSTLYKLLEDCAALVRRSIEGLDNFVMEGCRAFRDLESVVHKLGLNNAESKSVQENLQNAKRYLKSELKVHTSRECQVGDHCLSFALSSTELPFKSLCEHSHDMLCGDCENIDATLNLNKDKADEKVTLENKEAVMYTVEESILAVKKWKAHIIRSRNQEEARSSIVEDMTHTDVVITSDWAMKFLPRKYQEGQVDWFVKRGINWHIAVSLPKNQSSFSTITHIHVFESPTAQDAAVTSQILIDVAKDIMLQRQGVKHIHFFSDNAGCYKSSYTLLTLQQELSNSIVSYNFCEAQNRKGMLEAIDQEKKKDIKVKVVSSVNIVDVVSSKSNIPSISLMYNFHFTESGLRMWKAFSIGEGKLLKWNQLGTPSKTAELKTITDWIGGDIIRTNEDENGNEEDCSTCTKEARISVFGK